jgi:DNA/RNA non-specific endonuclease
MLAPAPLRLSTPTNSNLHNVEARNDPATLAGQILANSNGNIDQIRNQLIGLAQRDSGLAGEVRTLVEAQLTPTQRGELARSNSSVGQLPGGGTITFAEGGLPWGQYIDTIRAAPEGSKSRNTFDALSRAAGSSDNEAITRVLEYAANNRISIDSIVAAQDQNKPVANDNRVPAPPATKPPASSEGVGSFVEGAIKGDFSDNKSWSATAGQVVMGFVPIAGQIADARDTAAAIGQVWRGEDGGWLNLGTAAIGWVPGIGDGIKAGIRGGRKIGDAATEVGQQVARNGDEVAQGAVRQGNEVAGAAVDIAVRRFDNAGDFNRAANNALPNTRYEFGNYSYTTDARGRISTSEGQISLTPTGRNDPDLQSQIGREGRPTDIGFHVIADRFGGQTNRLNVIPGNGRPIGDGQPNLNQGAYKRFENRVATLAEQSDNNVEIRVTTQYDASNITNRPDDIIGAYRVNGGDWIEQSFVNK